MIEITDEIISVDTPNDLKNASLLLKKDKYTRKY